MAEGVDARQERQALVRVGGRALLVEGGASGGRARLRVLFLDHLPGAELVALPGDGECFNFRNLFFILLLCQQGRRGKKRGDRNAEDSRSGSHGLPQWWLLLKASNAQ